jgi:hypothetical protein
MLFMLIESKNIAMKERASSGGKFDPSKRPSNGASKFNIAGD